VNFSLPLKSLVRRVLQQVVLLQALGEGLPLQQAPLQVPQVPQAAALRRVLEEGLPLREAQRWALQQVVLLRVLGLVLLLQAPLQVQWVVLLLLQGLESLEWG
jgi:hypothetical protein